MLDYIFINFSLAEPALDLFDRMLELDPSKRISASEALLSNWLKEINEDTIRPIQYLIFQFQFHLFCINLDYLSHKIVMKCGVKNIND